MASPLALHCASACHHPLTASRSARLTFRARSRLRVVFSQFSVQVQGLPALNLLLPRPVGELWTSFCDDDMRLSRGGRGGLFVLKRFKMAGDSPGAAPAERGAAP